MLTDVMDNDDIILSDFTTANEIDEWDSYTQIQLVVSVEKEFESNLNQKKLHLERM